eukprot:8347001-Pyramimonas_sp.AAC.1
MIAGVARPSKSRWRSGALAASWARPRGRVRKPALAEITSDCRAVGFLLLPATRAPPVDRGTAGAWARGRTPGARGLTRPK